MKKIIVGIDAMGGDNAPSEIIKGVIKYINVYEKAKIILFGDELKIQEELKKYTFNKELISIKHTTEVILNDEAPTNAIKNKKDSSIVVGLKELKKSNIDAFISAGSTGALLAGATIIVGRIKGVERPALATLLPTEKNFAFLIDSGANVDCKPSYLEQFAKIGSIYMQNIFNIKSPKVALVNIGIEKEKGNSLTKEAFPLLEESNINFIGNIEARDIPKGDADVLVCDGFVGNIILKFGEGVARTIFNVMKREILALKNPISKLGALLLAPSLKNIRKNFDYSEVGGAAFLGLKGLVVKAHGSSNSREIKGAISQCVKFNELEIVSKIENML